jgi:putative DNA primase/helicase
MDDIAEVDAPFAPLKPDEIVPVIAPASEGELVLPVPTDAPPMLETHFALGQFSARWHYRDAVGAVLFAVLRFDKSNGAKEFWPLTLWRDAQRLQWRWKSVPAPRPLYNLDKLAERPTAPVVVCEGEKSADAAAQIFPRSVATTSPNGSSATSNADWSVLRGRQVLIWPDADKPGCDYAVNVGATLATLECEVSTIDADTLARTAPDAGTREIPKEGWDAADAISEWSDLVALRRAALKCRRPFETPLYISFGEFEMLESGLHREITRARGDKAEIIRVRVSAPFEIIGRGRDPDGQSWGRFLCWRDPDRRKHEKFVADEMLHGDPSTLCASLAAGGLEIAREHQRPFASYLSGTNPVGRVTVVMRTGWHVIDGEDVFVLPGECIGPKRTGRVLLDGAAHGQYETKGTLADWREGVAKLVAGHAIPMLAVSTAFAGPLLHLSGLEGGGLNLCGPSSRGKTTCLQAAASVWGRGGTPGFLRAWRATANGLEGAAAQSTDTVMVLDELGVVDARDAAQAFYGLANGQGKQRAARDGSPREPKSWRLLYLSSGELPVESKLAEASGRRVRAGQLVRLLDVPAERGAGFGVFDHGGLDSDAAALANAIKLAALSAYGTAGPAFVRKLISDSVSGDDVRGLIDPFVKSIIPAGSDGQVERAARRFGLLSAAGELAACFAIVPWQAGAAREAAAWALRRWIELRGGTEPAEERQAVECVRLFIEQHGDARFASLDDADARTVANRAGYRKGNGAEREWWVLPEVWRKEICTGLDAVFVARVLARARMLRTQAEGLQCKVRVRKGDNATLNAYVVTAAIFEGAADAR